jgi:hypothetical protein
MAKIFILNRQWFSKQAGNTTQTTKIYVNDVLVSDKVGSGYGEQYLSEATKELREMFNIPNNMNGWRGIEWLESQGHCVVNYSHDVSKRSDLE